MKSLHLYNPKAMIVEWCSAILVRLFFTTCGVVLIEIFGDSGMAYQILFILVALDFVTGFMAAFSNKEVSSKRMFKGLRKLFVYFVLVLASHQLVRLTGYSEWVEDGTVIYLAIMEYVSITENAAKMGVPIPTWIKDKLLTKIENDTKNA